LVGLQTFIVIVKRRRAESRVNLLVVRLGVARTISHRGIITGRPTTRGSRHDCFVCGWVGGWRLVSEMQERWKDASRGKNIDSQSARNSQPLCNRSSSKSGEQETAISEMFPPPDRPSSKP